MEEFRPLSSTEKEFLLDVCKNDPNRKILHIFFNIWKAIFFLSLISVFLNIIESIRVKEYFNLFSILCMPFVFLGFWVFPNFILKHIDAKFNALKENQVYIRETELVSTRHNRERTSKSTSHFKDVYYTTIWSEDRTHTYEILSHQKVFNMEPGTIVSVLRFNNTNNDINSEYIIPNNFENDSSIISLPL